MGQRRVEVKPQADLQIQRGLRKLVILRSAVDEFLQQRERAFQVMLVVQTHFRHRREPLGYLCSHARVISIECNALEDMVEEGVKFHPQQLMSELRTAGRRMAPALRR